MKPKTNNKFRCPYCASETVDNACAPCKIKFVYCKSCGQVMAETLEKCPKCGAKKTSKKK